MNAFFSGIPQLGESLSQYFILLGICSVRLLIVMIIFPPTADAVLQGVVRNALIMLWSLFVAFGQQALVPQLRGWFLLEMGLKEAVIGLVIAYMASSAFWVVEGVGAYVDNLTGYNNVQLTNPSQGKETSITSTLMSQCAIVAFWTLGGMPFLLGAIYASYRWWPLASVMPVPANILESFAMQQTDSIMQLVAKLAAPLVIVLLFVDLGLGLVAKTAQKLDLVSLAQPIKGALTVLMMALLIGIFIDQVHEQVALVGLSAQLHAMVGGK